MMKFPPAMTGVLIWWRFATSSAMTSPPMPGKLARPVPGRAVPKLPPKELKYAAAALPTSQPAVTVLGEGKQHTKVKQMASPTKKKAGGGERLAK